MSSSHPLERSGRPSPRTPSARSFRATESWPRTARWEGSLGEFLRLFMEGRIMSKDASALEYDRD